MEIEQILTVAKESIFILLSLSMPFLLLMLIIGLLISLLQAVTQIQEVSLTFVPKIVVLFLSLMLLLPYIGSTVGGFMTYIVSEIINIS